MNPAPRPAACGAFRKLALFSLCLVIGIFVGEAVHSALIALAVSALLGLCSGLSLLLPTAQRLRIFTVLLGLCCGLLRWSGDRLLTELPSEALDRQTVTLYGTVISPAEQRTYSSAVTVRSGDYGTVSLCFSDDSDLTLVPGTVVQAEVTLSAPSRAARSKGISLYGYADSLTVCGLSRSLSLLPARTSFALRQEVLAAFPNDGDVQGLFLALLTGDRGRLSVPLSTALSRCGLSHIVAVSGLHLGVITGFLFLFIRRRNTRLLVLPVLVLFALMIGSPSVWRAILMEGLLLTAPLVHREEDSLTSLSAALLVLAVIQPMSVFSVGLQLSFCSMLGVFVIGQPIYERIRTALPLGKHPRLPLVWMYRWFFGTVSVSLGAAAATLPLTAFYFRQISLISILSNLLVVWMLSALLLLGALAAVGGHILPFAAGFLSRLAAIPAGWVVSIVTALNRIPLAAIPLRSVYLLLWFGFFLLMLGLILISPRLRKRPWIPLGCGAAVLALSLVLLRMDRGRNPAAVTIFDVGQGQCILFCSDDSAVAVDCGGNAYTSAGDMLADYLQLHGYDRLDALILTHCDDDHVNGLSSLLSRITVEQCCLPEPNEHSEAGQAEVLRLLEQCGIPAQTVPAEGLLTCGQGQLTVYPAVISSSANGGLMVLAEFDGCTLFIPGDSDEVAEKIFTARFPLPQVDILIAGHHGSASATTEPLLAQTAPAVSVISVGRNSFGHPSEETLARLAAAGADIYRTDQNGTVTIHIS